MEGFFGTGTMVVCLKQVGTADLYRERLNIEVNTSARWSAQPLRTRTGSITTTTINPGLLVEEH